LKGPDSGEAERTRIFESFIEVVAERGYKATPLDAVLARAGIDEAAFHRYFADADACFRAAWDYISEGYMAKALAAYESEAGWRERIRAVGRAMLAYLTEHPHHARILFIEGPTPGERALAPLDPNIDVFIELIDSGRLEMDDPDSLTRATAEGLAGAVDERIAVCLLRGADEQLPGLLPELLYLVVRPYLGTEAAVEELHRGVD
jgi:AcrR family transcriptional regulator